MAIRCHQEKIDIILIEIIIIIQVTVIHFKKLLTRHIRINTLQFGRQTLKVK